MQEIRDLQEILSAALQEMRKNSGLVSQENQNLLRELKETRRKLDEANLTNRYLSCELAKTQEACEIIENERDYLRGEIQRLNQQLQQTRAESQALQTKWAQIRKFIAG